MTSMTVRVRAYLPFAILMSHDSVTDAAVVNCQARAPRSAPPPLHRVGCGFHLDPQVDPRSSLPSSHIPPARARSPGPNQIPLWQRTQCPMSSIRGFTLSALFGGERGGRGGGGRNARVAVQWWQLSTTHTARACFRHSRFDWHNDQSRCTRTPPPSSWPLRSRPPWPVPPSFLPIKLALKLASETLLHT